MLCNKCNKNTATVYVKQGVNGVYREYNLCEKCAAEVMPANIHNEYAFPSVENINPFVFLTDGGLFSNIMESKYKQRRVNEDLKQNYSCKTCGSTLGGILKLGKFGCGDCYTAFYSEVLPGIVKIHANKEYTGRMPKKFKAKLNLKEKITALKNELSAAVEQQDFEKAAELRDKINAISEGGEANNEQ